MAGDWLKFECSTPDKPEVLAITAKMGWDDPDLTVGKLFRVWRWFDQHTTNGNASGVTTVLLDRIAGATGFAQAMEISGWLTVTAEGLELPNFEKHNGATAKSRAQTAKRVANHRALEECNAETVTQPLAREDVDVEKSKPLKSKSRAEASATATRLPADWIPSPEDVEFCKTHRKDLDPSLVAESFRDYWLAAAGAKGRKQDWPATWRNWVRNEKGPQARAGPVFKTIHDQRAETIAGLTGRTRNERTTANERDITGEAIRVA